MSEVKFSDLPVLDMLELLKEIPNPYESDLKIFQLNYIERGEISYARGEQVCDKRAVTFLFKKVRTAHGLKWFLIGE